MESFVLAAILGLVVGVLAGILGIGGGTLMIPIMRLGFGLSTLQATSTSLFTMVFTSVAGSVTHVRNGTCIARLSVLAGVCGACMSPVGVHLANLSPAWLVMTCTAAVIAYSAITMLRKGLAMPKPEKKTETSAESGGQASQRAGWKEAAKRVSTAATHAPQEAYLKASDLSRRQYAFGMLAGLIAGLAGGYVGLGGGFLLVPVFVAGVKLSMKQATGTSLLAVCILSIAGSIAQAMHGNVEPLVGLALAAGSIPGAVIGSNFVRYVPERSLRIAFGVMLVFTSALLVINELVV